MKGNKTRVITLLILIAFALIVGCSHETPTPSNKNNAPSTGTDKEETVITVPEWLKDKNYRIEDRVVHFNEVGIPSLGSEIDLTIIAAETGKVTYKVIDSEGNESTQYITSGDNGHSITITNEKSEPTVLYLDVDGPEWLKNKSFINSETGSKLEFNSRGLLDKTISGHSFAYIGSMTDTSVEFIYLNNEGTKEPLNIMKIDNDDIQATMGTESGTFEPM